MRLAQGSVLHRRPDGEERGLVIAKAEKQLRRSGDSPLKGSYEPLQVLESDRRRKTFARHLNIDDLVKRALQQNLWVEIQ